MIISSELDNEPKLYSTSDLPFGKSWKRWVESWWRWCYSYGEGESPLLDKTGGLCSKGQLFNSVWFLGGTFGGKAERVCRIRAGKAIFFPILNDLVSFHTDPQLQTETDLHLFAKADLDNTISLKVKIDGHPVKNLYSYRVHSSIFQITLLPDKRSSIPVNTKAVSDGFWIFLKPLNHGQHTIEFSGKKIEFDLVISHDELRENPPKFHVEVKYLLNVF
jgi:hypothetical protein